MYQIPLRNDPITLGFPPLPKCTKDHHTLGKFQTCFFNFHPRTRWEMIQLDQLIFPNGLVVQPPSRWGFWTRCHGWSSDGYQLRNFSRVDSSTANWKHKMRRWNLKNVCTVKLVLPELLISHFVVISSIMITVTSRPIHRSLSPGTPRPNQFKMDGSGDFQPFPMWLSSNCRGRWPLYTLQAGHCLALLGKAMVTTPVQLGELGNKGG